MRRISQKLKMTKYITFWKGRQLFATHLSISKIRILMKTNKDKSIYFLLKT